MRLNIKYLEILLLISFSAAVCFFFGNNYKYHIHFQEQMQLFQFGWTYFFTNTLFPGGTINYIGEFLTQFYVYHWLGAIIITILLIIAQFLTRLIIFGDRTHNPWFYLSFVPSILYWALLCDDQYYLSGLIGLIFGLTAIYIYSRITDRYIRILTGIFMLVLLYFLAGGIYMMYLLSIIIIENKNTRIKRDWISVISLIGLIILAVVLPLLVRQFMIIGPSLQSYISGYYYQIPIYLPIPLIILWSSIPVLILILRTMQVSLNRKTTYIFAIILFFVLLTGTGFLIYKFTNQSEENIMAFDYFARMENWDQIVALAEKEEPTDKNSMVALNLALAMKGQLSDKIFKFTQNPEFLFIHYDKHGMVSHLASDVYYHLGFMNFALMAACESNESSIDAKNSVRSFKRIAEIAIINGQYKIAEKYLHYLKNTLMYSNWAIEAESYLYNDFKIENHPVWGIKRKQRPKTDYFLNKDRMNLVLIRSLSEYPNNLYVYEYLMTYYLLNKDFDGFLKNINIYPSFGYRRLPRAWQEAMVYIYSLSPEISDYFRNIPVDNDIFIQIKNYASLFKMGNDKAKKLLQKDFGDTYWYYLHFTKITSDSILTEHPKSKE